MPFNTQGYANLFGGVVGESGIGSTDIDYVRNTPIPYAVGGAPAGTVFTGSIADALDRILYPAVSPSITLSSDVHITNRQLGLDTIPTLTLTARTTQKTFPILKIEFFEGSNLLDTQQYVVGTTEYTYKITKPITNTTRFSVKVTDAKGKSATSSISYNFYYPNFSVISSNEIADITIQEIVENGIKRIESKANKTITYTGNMSRYIFCYPKEWGEISSILDSNNFEYKNAFQKVYLTYTSGTTSVPMVAYISKEKATINNFKYTFKF